MPRIRTIKPDFFTSTAVAALPLRARLTWVGLWTQADDHGRLKDHAAVLRGALWPLDEVTADDVEVDLCELAKRGRIVRYHDAEDKHYLAIVGWHEHQRVNRPSPSRIPAPPHSLSPHGGCSECNVAGQTTLTESSLSVHGVLTESSLSVHGVLTEPSLTEVEVEVEVEREREGEGEGEPEGEPAPSPPPPRRPDFTTHHPPRTRPPRHCPQHTGSLDDPPCRACADARREADTWQPPTPIPSRPECPRHPGRPTGSKTCPDCAREAVPPPNLRAALHHQPETTPETPCTSISRPNTPTQAPGDTQEEEPPW